MRMALQIFVGIPAMIGLYFLVRLIVTGISLDFGWGFFIGLITMAALFALVERLDPESFYGRRDRRLRE